MASLVSALPRLMSKFRRQVPCLLRRPNFQYQCLLSTRCMVLDTVTSSQVLTGSAVQFRQVHTNRSLCSDRRPSYLKKHVPLFPVIPEVPANHTKKGHLAMYDFTVEKKVLHSRRLSFSMLCLVTVFGLPALYTSLPNSFLIPGTLIYLFPFVGYLLSVNSRTKKHIETIYYNDETGVFTISTLLSMLSEEKIDTTFTLEEVTEVHQTKNEFYVMRVGKQKFFFSPSSLMFRDRRVFMKLTGETCDIHL